MKLHLPKTLRAALAAIATAALPVATTVATGVWALGSQVYAEGESEAAGRSLATSTTTVGDVEYNGDVYTYQFSNNGDKTFNAQGTSFYGSTWENDAWVYAETATTGDTAQNYFITGGTSDVAYGNTLHLASKTSANGRVRFSCPSDLVLGGLIVDAGNGSDLTNNVAYWLFNGTPSGGSITLNGTNDVNLTINDYTRISSGKLKVLVKKGGAWTVAAGKTLLFDNASSSSGNPAGMEISANQQVAISGGGTVQIGISNTGNYTLSLVAGSGITVKGEGTKLVLGSGGAATVAAGASLTIEAGAELQSAAPITNSGTITNNGTLKLSGSLTTVNANLGAVVFTNDSASIQTKDGGTREITLGSLTLESNGLLKTYNWNGTWNIGSLNLGDNKTLTLEANSNHSDWATFKLTGSTCEGSGVINLKHTGSTGGERKGALWITSENAISGAVVNMVSMGGSSNNSTLNLILGASNVNIAGLKTDGSVTNAQRMWVLSNDELNTVSDDTARTLTITGSGTYAYAGGVSSKVNITMRGSGSQSFTGNLSAFDGNVTVENGSLTLANSSSGTAMSIGTLDVQASATAVTIGGLTEAATVTLAAGKSITIGSAEGSELTHDGVTYSNGAVITNSGTAAKGLSVWAKEFTILGGDVEIGGSAIAPVGARDVNAIFNGSSINFTGSGKFYLSGTQNINTLQATVDTATFEVDGDSTIGELTGFNSVTVNGEKSLTVTTATTNSTTLKNGATLNIEGQYTSGNETISAYVEGSNAVVTSAGDNKTLSVQTEGLTYTHADITVDTTETVNTAATLNGSKLTVTGGGTVAANVAENSTNDFDATQGNVVINATAAKVGTLAVGADKTVTVGDGSGTATVSGTATIANGGTVSGNVTIADSGTLTISGTGFTGDGFGAMVDGTLTANTVTLANAIDVTGVTTTTKYVLATAQSMSISGALNAADFYTGTLAGNVTASVAVEDYNTGTLSFTPGASAQQLVLTLTATAVQDLTITGSAWSDGALVVTVENLGGVTSGDLALTVTEAQWEAMVAAVTGAGKSISEAVEFKLTDSTLAEPLALSGFGTVTFNTYAGEGNGTYAVIYIPEPTTGTLSVLALAALALRRRRK